MKSDLSNVKGQEHAKRALEVAAAGGHHLLLVGPPGCGKSSLARLLYPLLPPLTPTEGAEVEEMRKAWQPVDEGGRPQRMPSLALRREPKMLLVEAILAHRGVLLLDDLPLFGGKALELLRAPLDTGEVHIARRGEVPHTWPAHFQLVAAMEPCPCGYFGSPTRDCLCTPAQVTEYRRQLWPIRGYFHIVVHIPQPDLGRLLGRNSECTETVRARVVRARRIQQKRFGMLIPTYNADLGWAGVEKWCALDDTAMGLLKAAAKQLSLNPRGVCLTLKVARTIADLNGADSIGVTHLAEAIQYRGKDC